MTAAQVTAMFSEEDHPRSTEGSTAGQFAKKDGSSSSSKPPAKKAAPAKTTPKRKGRTRRVIPKGQLGFDGVSGTGYGVKGGDKRVRALQEELNRLGLTDVRGRKLRVDGELGPLTTQAIRDAQRRLGMKPTGIIAPAFIDRLRATKAVPKTVKKAAPRRPSSRVRANFDPDQPRDEEGKWSKIAAAVHAIGNLVGSEVKLHEEFGQGGSSHGFVALHDNGRITISAMKADGGGDRRIDIDESEADDLADALEVAWDFHRGRGEAGRESGNGWDLEWDADGAKLYGIFHDDALSLSREDVESLADAVRETANRGAMHDDLTAVAPLRSGETLATKKGFARSGEHPLGVAVVDGPEGRTVRLAPTSWLDPDGEGKDLKNYTGGEGMSSAKLDEASAERFRAELAAMTDEAAARQKVLERAMAKYDEDGDDDAFDAVAKPFASTDPYVSSPDGYDIDGNFGRRTEIETPWGTLVAQGYSDELGAWSIQVGVRPKGAVPEVDWHLGGAYLGPDPITGELRYATLATKERGYELPYAELEPKDAKALVKYLGTAFGTSVSAASPVNAAELRGIELARPGRWKLASGPMTVTKQHLIDAARYAQRATARPGYVKIGHNDPRFAPGDGEPALGWVHNVRYAEDERGPKLVGDIHDMPDWLAAAAPTAWPDRSIEGWADFTDEDGEKYALVVDGVALLGVTPPGMSSIQSLRDLPKAVGVAAASGTRVVASMSSAPMAVEKGAGPMDPAKTREALGLPAGASDDEVRSAMTVALQSLSGDAGPAQQPVQASLFGEESTQQPAPKPSPAAIPPGMQLVSASAWAEREDTIKHLTAFVEQSKRDKRDDVIAQAVKAGKFTPAQKPHFAKLWDADPDGTRELIEKLTPNTALAVLASGYATENEDAAFEAEFAHLFPPAKRS